MKTFNRIILIWGFIVGWASLYMVKYEHYRFIHGDLGYLFSFLCIALGMYGLFFRYTRNIFDAVKYNQLDKVKNYLDRKVNINGLNKEGLTPLHYAVEKKKIQSIEYLLSRNADANIKTADGKSIVDFINAIDSPKTKTEIQNIFDIDTSAKKPKTDNAGTETLVNKYHRSVKCVFCGNDFNGRSMPVIEFIKFKSANQNIYKSSGIICKLCETFICEACQKAGKIEKKAFVGVGKTPCPKCGELLASSEQFVTPMVFRR